MNTYLFYRRITWPIMLLTFGVTALLDQWHVVRFGQSWPLYLIVYGVLRLAEGAALAAQPLAPPVSPSGWAPAGWQPASTASGPVTVAGTGLVPAPHPAIAPRPPYPPSLDEES